jgi:hypothetical protein
MINSTTETENPLNSIRLEKLVQRISWQEGYDRAKRDEVLIAMLERCAEQGHDYENCCSLMFRIYQRCKWCGEER